MPLNPLNSHYSMENPASVYDEEALTALELAGRTTAKVNETVKAFNKLEGETNAHLDNQDETIATRLQAQDNKITKMNDVTMPEKVKTEFQSNLDNGTFENMVDTYAGNLEARVDNLLGSVTEGSTTGDAELIDIRVRATGDSYDNAGSATRAIDTQLQEAYFDLHTKLIPIEAKCTLQGYVTSSGSYSNSVDCANTGLIPCQGYKTIRYTTFMGPSGIELAFYDADRNLMPDISIIGRNSRIENTVSLAGINAHYVRLSLYVPSLSKESAYLIVEGENIRTDIDKLAVDVTDTQSVLQSAIAKNAPLATHQVFRGENIWEKSNDCWSTELIPIGTYKYLHYRTKINKAYYSVAFFDEKQVVMSGISISGTDNVQDSVIEISNLGATYVCVCSYAPGTVSPANYFCKLFTYDCVNEIEQLKKASGYGLGNGKKMLIFGDSITETATMDDDGGNYVEGTSSNWPTYVKPIIGDVAIKNYAHWGAKYVDFSTDYPRQKMTTQVNMAISDTGNDDSEIIVISLGANDASPTDSYDTAMAVANRQSLDTSKLYQAIRYAMWTLRTKYPTALCFVATPIQRASREPIHSLYKAICEMGNRYNFIVIDAQNESGIVRENEVNDGAGVFLTDGLHPNTAGKKKMAELYGSKISQYLKEV